MSGKVVEVITGFAVINTQTNTEISDYEVTKVFIDDLSPDTIKSYVKTGEPLDKAGAFGIQEMWAILVKKIEGDYFNIVWLPLFKLNKALSQVGICIFKK